MVTIDATAERREGVTFVAAVVRNGSDQRRRVRVESRLDGPVWPPRRRGVPERGWDADGVTVRIPPGERRALGFATPVSPEAEPVEIAGEAVTDGTEAPIEGTPEGVVRALGDPVPPPDAVPASGSVSSPNPVSPPDADDGDRREPTADSDQPPLDAPQDGDDPTALAAWLARAAPRVALAAELHDASVDAAATTLEDSDVESAAALGETLDAVADRARELAERADDGKETVATLRRLP